MSGTPPPPMPPMGGTPPPPPPPPGGYGYGYGGGVPPVGPKTNGLAIASLVTSLVSILFLCLCGIGFLGGIAGAVMGFMAKKRIAETGENGSGMATGGIVVGLVVVVLGIIGFLLWIVGTIAGNRNGYYYWNY